MTIDHDSIAEKNARLRQAIRVLKKLRRQSLQELENDEIAMGAVLHYLMLGIEVILDIGSHILTEDFEESAETYEDIIVFLGKKKIIASSLAQKARGIGKFRNKMIHEYADIDFKKVYAYLQHAPEHFLLFDVAFRKYLKKAKTRKRK